MSCLMLVPMRPTVRQVATDLFFLLFHWAYSSLDASVHMVFTRVLISCK